MAGPGKYSPESWEQGNAESAAFKDFFRPAYHAALAPVVAGSIDFQHRVLGKKRVRILVVGGGKGVFTAKLLPAAIRLFKSAPPKIEVFETDPSEVIVNAPQSAFRVRADASWLPFKDARFDLAFGESMIHNQGARGVEGIVGEVRRVLKPDGIFFHVQDFTPRPDLWLNFKDYELMRSGPVKEQKRLARLIHQRLIRAIRQAATTRRMNFSSHKLKGAAVSDSNPIAEQYGEEVKTNSYVFSPGSVRSGIDASLPKGSARFEYNCYLTISSRYPRPGEFIKHANSNFKARLPRPRR